MRWPQYVPVSEKAGRAEDIASHLVAHALGVEVKKFDVDGRQSAVDFMLSAAMTCPTNEPVDQS